MQIHRIQSVCMTKVNSIAMRRLEIKSLIIKKSKSTKPSIPKTPKVPMFQK